MSDDEKAGPAEEAVPQTPPVEGGAPPVSGHVQLENLARIAVPLSVVLATKQMVLEDILNLSSGSVVEFEKSHKDPIDLVVAGKAIARGDAVTIRDKFGIKITEIGSARETLKKLGGEEPPKK